MAYNNPVPKVTKITENTWIVDIIETDCTDEEVEITGLPAQGKVIRSVCVLETGTATHVNPILSTKTELDAGQIDTIFEYETTDTDTEIVDEQGLEAVYYSKTGVLYHRSRPDTGSDNDITTRYFIERQL